MSERLCIAPPPLAPPHKGEGDLGLPSPSSSGLSRGSAIRLGVPAKFHDAVKMRLRQAGQHRQILGTSPRMTGAAVAAVRMTIEQVEAVHG